MRNKITTEDLIKKRFSTEESEKIFEEINQEVKKWGGARPNSGRKLKTGKVLKFSVRLSDEEKLFIEYARKHNIDYKELMQG